MSEMVERGARLFAGLEGWDWDKLSELEDTSLGWGKNHIRGTVYQLIRMMREPTAGMKARGIDADDMRTGGETCAHIYRAMIDAALREPEGKEGD